MKNEKLTFTCGEGGEAEEFFVVEQTRLNGVTYLLVADSEEDDADLEGYKCAGREGQRL